MMNTPEASLINLRTLDLRRFQRLKEKVDELSLRRIITDGDFELIRLFHFGGFEQLRSND
jgi:hypothetical protein